MVSKPRRQHVDALERYDRLTSVNVARSILRDAFGLELLVIGSDGPVAHQRGGIMSSSSEVCRAVLFSRTGFQACDAFYRELGKASNKKETARPCHVGLASISVPAVLGERVLAHVVASGFEADGLKDIEPIDRTSLVEALREITGSESRIAEGVRSLPTIEGNRAAIVQSILRTAASAIVEEEESRRSRRDPEDGEPPGFWGLVGSSPQMQVVFDQLARVAKSHATVLVIGDSGTGKELIARALVEHGPRSNMPFVAQSCGALSDELLESTLFGHVRGAFSGAIRTSNGLFGAAEGGTLFLDEVSEMSPSMQVKLLRVLQDRSYFPLGGTTARSADVRIVAASRFDLHELVEADRFRQDLYYRLHVLPIALPPLRDRTGDLPILTELFLSQNKTGPRTVSESAWTCLKRHTWPGNVRELRAEVERWAVSGEEGSKVGPEHLSLPIRKAGGYFGGLEDKRTGAEAGTATLAHAIEALERSVIRQGLERTGGNRTRLAKQLDISRTTLNERLKKYGMEDL